MQAYALEKNEYMDKLFSKMAKKNRKHLYIIRKKLIQILDDPHRFKPLRSDMKNYRAVHIDSHFVLVYTINETNKTVKLIDYNNHDKIFF